MNERIKELAEQAKFMAEETINKQISVNAELDAFAEKFAELLLVDVDNIIYTQHAGHYSDYTDMSNSQERRDIRKACCSALTIVRVEIGEHFGVEE